MVGLRRALVLASIALLVCCVSGPAAQRAGASRALLISFDGLGGVRLGQLLAAGKLRAGGFAAFAERGVIAGRAVTVTPSLTSVAHIATITGAPPQRTGIVSNVFHRAGDPPGTTVSGFSADIEAETLWEAAMRHGKRVGVLVYPGADGKNVRRRGSFGVVWPEKPLQAAAFLTVPAGAWRGAAGGGASPDRAREAAIEVATPGGPLRLRLEALHSTDHRARGWDLVRVSAADGSRPALASVRPGGWFQVVTPSRDGELTGGAWCRLMTLDVELERVVLYVGAFYGVPAYPEDFRRRLEAAVGPWPGQPDDRFLLGPAELRSEAAYEEQSMRLADYLTRMLLTTMRDERWDLLLHYQPDVDEVEHAFELGPGDPGGVPDLSGGVDERIERAFLDVDRELAQIVGVLRPSDSLFVHSDHAMTAVDRAVDLERFLASRGWRVVHAGDGAGAPERSVQVCSSSGIAHLYLRRDTQGAAPRDTLTALRHDLERLPAEHGVPLDELLEGPARGRVGLDHPNAGDLVVLLRPGCTFERNRGGSAIVFPPHASGAHGYRNAYAPLDASFLALGPSIRASRPASVSLLDVAARVAEALGIGPPGGR